MPPRAGFLTPWEALVLAGQRPTWVARAAGPGSAARSRSPFRERGPPPNREASFLAPPQAEHGAEPDHLAVAGVDFLAIVATSSGAFGGRRNAPTRGRRCPGTETVQASQIRCHTQTKRGPRRIVAEPYVAPASWATHSRASAHQEARHLRRGFCRPAAGRADAISSRRGLRRSSVWKARARASGRPVRQQPSAPRPGQPTHRDERRSRYQSARQARRPW